MIIVQLLLCVATFLCRRVTAVQTWPSSSDEIEDLMFLQNGYRARGFATPVTPCSSSPQVNGRVTAAEWLRTAFHDVASGNVITKTGGLDASIIFETGRGENDGQGFITTVNTLAPFLSSRSSMADLIALATYTAVRSCGGPVIPIRTGRKDAISAGPSGQIPLPQNSLFTFQNQFQRIGFNATEMISLVACGHTLGGVHAASFPEIVPPGSAPDDFQRFDGTDAFDARIAADYVTGNSTDPLVGGRAKAAGRDSDMTVFSSDGNITITTMVDPQVFTSVCSTLLQRMIEVVPNGVILTDPIVPYEVKPTALQLTLLGGGDKITFVGEIRIRTTTRSSNQISRVQLNYKDRNGNSCSNCSIETALKGSANGIDDSFTFYEFSTMLSSETSISAFEVIIILTTGTTELYNNNGVGYAIQDSIMVQVPQSCLVSDSSGSGKQNLTVIAAVRDSISNASVSMNLGLKATRSNSPVPSLSPTTIAMSPQTTLSHYKLYAASYMIDISQSRNTRFGVAVSSDMGQFEDSFKSVEILPTSCNILPPTPPTTSSTSSSTTMLTTTVTTNSTTTSSSSIVSPPSSSLSVFVYQGCFKDSVSRRTLKDALLYNNSMTIDMCAEACNKFQYFGLEYGSECYCGNTRDLISNQTLESDCSFYCSGNSQQLCGAGDRLSLYTNLKYIPVSNPSIIGYQYQGCYNDSVTARVLADASTANSSLTVESCSKFCANFIFFGVEYGQECYCGSKLMESSTKQSENECSFTCAGNSSEYCGAGNRLNVYQKMSL